MLELDCKQGSREWARARLGIVTASNFSQIVTQSGNYTKKADEYLAKLLAQWALGDRWEEFGSTYYTERGIQLEPKARQWYELETDCEVRQVGMVYRDEGRMVSASPDGLVGSDGGLELKVPSPAKHLFYLALNKLPTDYRMQVQGSLWVTGRKWWDFASWNPQLPTMLVRVYPEYELHAKFDEHILPFVDRVLNGRKALLEQGVEPYDDGDGWNGL